MISFSAPCIYCKNKLAVSGMFLETETGNYICCDVCRALYHIENFSKENGKAIFVMNVAHFDPETEFDIIRHAKSITPISEIFTNKEKKKPVSLKDIIQNSKSPDDLIRKLSNE